MVFLLCCVLIIWVILQRAQRRCDGLWLYHDSKHTLPFCVFTQSKHDRVIRNADKVRLSFFEQFYANYQKTQSTKAVNKIDCFNAYVLSAINQALIDVPKMNQFIHQHAIYKRLVRSALLVEEQKSVGSRQQHLRMHKIELFKQENFASLLHDCAQRQESGGEEEGDFIWQNLMKLSRLSPVIANMISLVVCVLDKYNLLPLGWVEKNVYHVSVLVHHACTMGFYGTFYPLANHGNCPLSLGLGVQRMDNEQNILNLFWTFDARVASIEHWMLFREKVCYYLENAQAMELGKNLEAQ